MHRSGTSLTARYLSECGLFIGHDLYGKHWSNPTGHFEDKDFVLFHNGILKAHHVNYAVSSPIDWKIDETTIDRARAIIEARNSFYQWGWKDPRTTLFLPFWKKLIPSCHFVIVYRHYLPVVRSLISRDILADRSKTSRLQRMLNPQLTKKPTVELFDKYLRTWIWYNHEIITHLLNDSNVKYHLVTYDQLVRGDFSILNGLKNHGFKIKAPSNFNKFPKRAPFIKDIPTTADTVLLSEADEIDKYFSVIGRHRND